MSNSTTHQNPILFPNSDCHWLETRYSVTNTRANAKMTTQAKSPSHRRMCFICYTSTESKNRIPWSSRENPFIPHLGPCSRY